MSVMYKIRSRKTGLFSTGGTNPAWSSIGKIWTVQGHLSSHFTGLSAAGRREYNDEDAEIVEVEFTLKGSTPVAQFIQLANGRKQAREDLERKRRAERKAKLELAEFERLQQKFRPSTD